MSAEVIGFTSGDGGGLNLMVHSHERRCALEFVSPSGVRNIAEFTPEQFLVFGEAVKEVANTTIQRFPPLKGGDA